MDFLRRMSVVSPLLSSVGGWSVVRGGSIRKGKKESSGEDKEKTHLNIRKHKKKKDDRRADESEEDDEQAVSSFTQRKIDLITDHGRRQERERDVHISPGEKTQYALLLQTYSRYTLKKDTEHRHHLQQVAQMMWEAVCALPASLRRKALVVDETAEPPPRLPIWTVTAPIARYTGITQKLHHLRMETDFRAIPKDTDKILQTTKGAKDSS